MKPQEQRTESVHKDCATERVKEIDKRPTEVNGNHEDEVHDCKKNGDTGDPVEQDLVDGVGDGSADLAVAVHDVADESMNKTVTTVRHDDVEIFAGMLFDVLGLLLDDLGNLGTVGDVTGNFIVVQNLERQPPLIHGPLLGVSRDGRPDGVDGLLQFGVIYHVRLRCLPRFGGLEDGVAEFGQAGAFGSDNRHNRAIQMPGEVIQLNSDAAFAGDVTHAEYDNHRHLHLQKLGGQEQVALEIGGINNVDHEVRLIGQDVFAGDGLIDGVCREGVDTGQVRHVNPRAAMFIETIDALDRDARPVTHALVRARERVEEGGLPAVGIPGNADLDAIHGLRRLSCPVGLPRGPVTG